MNLYSKRIVGHNQKQAKNNIIKEFLEYLIPGDEIQKLSF